MDITERKQSEEEKEETRKLEAELAEKLRDVIETMPTMVWIASADGSNEFANHHWQEYTGLSHERTVGSAWQDVVHPADLERHLEKWRASRASGAPFENEVRYRRAADGQYRWFLSRAVPLRDGKGEIVKWYGVSTDIEERKRAEERLRESEAYLAEAQRLSQTGSWAWSPATGDIRYWSETCYRVLGFDPTGPLPRFEEFFLRIHPGDQAALRERFDEAIRDKADFELDYRLVHPEKGIRDIHAVGHAVLDGSGNLAEFVGTVIDVTERKRAEQELQQSETDLRSKNERLNLLLNVTNQITSNLELQHLLRSISAGIRGVMRCDMVAITMPDSQTEGQRLLALDFPGGKGLIREGLLLTPVGPGGRALESLKPTVVSPLDPDAFSPEVRESAIAEGLQQHCVIPLANRGRAFGALVIARTTDVSFSPENLEFLAQVSGQIAIAIENALAFEDRKRAEDKIRDQESELRQILDLAPQHVRVYGPGGERLYANRIALDYYGVSLEEWRQTRGHPFRSSLFVHPDDQERAARGFDVNSSSGSAYELEVRVRGADGNYRWFLVRHNPLHDDKGQVKRWYVALTDIDERKRAEERLQQENVALREEIDKASMFEEIVGTSPALKTALSRISKVAPSDSTVLITGETGTGKELVARAIHRRSDRASRAFVSVNCAAIPRELIASELFGHEKGAFTGAIQQRLGRFELANGGTIFLDEVGELPLETQIALLRVLQEHEFERVGGTRPIRADVRVIAATNRDLEAAISAGSFRSDLFYRLHVFPIEIPPLRERREDIPLLVEYFIDRYARRAGKRVTTVEKRTLQVLQSYPWPGNIRELQNVIERSVIVCETENFSVDESWLSRQPVVSEPTRRLAAPLAELRKTSTEQPHDDLHEVKQVAQQATESQSGKSSVANEYARKQRGEIVQALTACKGRVGGADGAAARLGMNRTTLLSRMKKFGIHAKQFA